MQLQNKLLSKDRIAYLGALTLLFSYAEIFIPKIVPFFRLGLGNTVMLLALNLNLPSLLVLALIKAVSSSLLNGTLLSPFFVISLLQSLSCAMAMFLLNKLNTKASKKLFSLYGISLISSALSAFIQIEFCSLYLGTGTYSLLGPMLLFSIFSGIITAFLADFLKIPEQTPSIISNTDNGDRPLQKNTLSMLNSTLLIINLFLCSLFSLINHNLVFLFIELILAFGLQIITGRRIMILPHLSIWAFVIISTMFIPCGKVLVSFGKIVLTEGALLAGLEKALKLSVISSLSQSLSFTTLDQSSNLLGITMNYFSALCQNFKNQEDSGKFVLFKKIKKTLETPELILQDSASVKKRSPKLKLLFSLGLVIVFCFLAFYNFNFIHWF